MPQTRARTSHRRDEILNAALDCFSRNGFDATTVSEIRHAADCSIGSFYHHFGSKDGVAGALSIDGLGRLNRGRIKKLRGCEDAKSGVKSLVRYYADWVTRNRALARYLTSRDMVFTDQTRQILRTQHREHMEEIAQWFRPYIDAGEIKRLPRDTYTALINGAIQDYARHWLSGRLKGSPGSVKEIFAEAAWNAVKT